jgi:transcriptional regulator with XRE-family HTH domain
MKAMEIESGVATPHFSGAMFGRKLSYDLASCVREIDDEPQDLQASAGEALRAARLAADLSIDEFATQTRIPVRVLRAIESYDFTDPRSRVGGIGCAIQVARRLGVDENWVSREVRAAMMRVPERVYRPIEPAEDIREHYIALSTAAALFVTFVAVAAGLCFLILL